MDEVRRQLRERRHHEGTLVGARVRHDEIREIAGVGSLGPDRSLSVKFSRLFDLGGDWARAVDPR